MIPNFRIEETFEQVEMGEKPESHFQLVMERIWRTAQNEFDRMQDVSTEDLLAELEDADVDDPFIDALEGLVLWERENDYHDGAVPALDALEKVVEQALNDEWYNVGIYAAVQAAYLAIDVSQDETGVEWLERIDGLFGQYWCELSPNMRSNVVEAIPDLQYVAGEDIVQKLLDTLRDVAEEAAEQDNLGLERRIYWRVKKVQHDREWDTEDAEEELIDSYNTEASLMDDQPHQKASILQEALSSCAEFASEDQLIEWKREMREANKQAIEGLPRIEHELDEDEVRELEEGIEQDVENLSELSVEESGVSALMTILAHQAFLPQLDAIESGAKDNPLHEILPRRYLKSEGDSIPDPDEESRASMYQVGVQHRDNVLTAMLDRILRERIITEGDLYIYLMSVEDITVHDKAYLTDFIIGFFDERFADALHVGVFRLEGVIASELKANGFEPASLKDGYTTPTPLPGLLNMLDGEVDENLVEYLRYRYADISGESLRNKVAHGRAGYSLASRRLCLILLYDLFRTIAWLEDELE